jgi:large subunit ribosomal protein L24
MALTIKKEDKVRVIAGNEKGKQGRVLFVDREKNRLTIEGINIRKKNMKPNRQFQKGGIIDKAMPVHRSNVMLVCPKCSKTTKISVKFLQDNRKVRVCNKCAEVIDS